MSFFFFFLYLCVISFFHGEGNGNPFQYSCLENPMDEGACQAVVHGVTKSWARLSDFTFTFHFHALEKEMATRSSVLAWRIPGTGEPGGLPSVGSHRVGHEVTQQQVINSLKAMTLYKSLNMWVQDLTFQQYFEDFLGKKREREGMRERKETLDESVRALS